MRSFLYKLQFTTPVHFGPSDSALSLYSSGATFCADTLFSALCHTALALQGPAGLEALCRWVQAGELLLSDGMPWHRDIFYLPKPMIQSQTSAELPAADRKAMTDRYPDIEDACKLLMDGNLQYAQNKFNH